MKAAKLSTRYNRYVEDPYKPLKSKIKYSINFLEDNHVVRQRKSIPMPAVHELQNKFQKNINWPHIDGGSTQ